MDAKLIGRCELLARNKKTVSRVFPWEMTLMHAGAAVLYAVEDREIDEMRLRRAKLVLKKSAGVFSPFRGAAFPALAAMLDRQGDPEEMLAKSREMLGQLRMHLHTSPYLPLCAMAAVTLVQPGDYARIASRTGFLFRTLKKEHPFLTTGEDAALCTLLALSPRDDYALLGDIREGYSLLRRRFLSNDAALSLAMTLALYELPVAEKCARTVDLFDRLKMAGCRYGASGELPTLGVLAMAERPLTDIVGELCAADDCLSRQKGFGVWSMTPRQRRMFAGLLLQEATPNADTAMISAAVGMVLAQQAAVCAAVAASAASSSSH